MPNKLQTVVAVFGVFGVLAALDLYEVWDGGVAYVPVLLIYLVATAVLYVRHPLAPWVSIALATVPPLFGTALAIAVASGWEPVDLPVSMTDEPLSESPQHFAPYVLYVGFLVAVVVWARSALRRDEVKAYFAGRDAPAV